METLNLKVFKSNIITIAKLYQLPNPLWSTMKLTSLLIEIIHAFMIDEPITCLSGPFSLFGVIHEDRQEVFVALMGLSRPVLVEEVSLKTRVLTKKRNDLPIDIPILVRHLLKELGVNQIIKSYLLLLEDWVISPETNSSSKIRHSTISCHAWSWCHEDRVISDDSLGCFFYFCSCRWICHFISFLCWWLLKLYITIIKSLK